MGTSRRLQSNPPIQKEFSSIQTEYNFTQLHDDGFYIVPIGIKDMFVLFMPFFEFDLVLQFPLENPSLPIPLATKM